MRRVITGAILSLFPLASGAVAQPAATDGAQVYDENCAECHGKNLVSAGTVPDLKKLGSNDKGRFLKVMAEGNGQMPSFAGTLEDEQIEKIWLYIRSKADN